MAMLTTNMIVNREENEMEIKAYSPLQQIKRGYRLQRLQESLKESDEEGGYHLINRWKTRFATDFNWL
ncbi:hypothetical protein L0B53_04450 [Vibrio sp. SS-MA-C1-2]|uniref:hypothetical protein n=1 Tax=Vibrio sp. SS-MA-C1-2 TaxID=2908646 RepID=UPI001F1DCB29|nr:hypothetical protein [Vibrio sp. SS-MA-C1-2]UJF17171.1 hypothetical protein L0B53_04450 [Vibrio sp. SS-MA-C1-2]